MTVRFKVTPVCLDRRADHPLFGGGGGSLHPTIMCEGRQPASLAVISQQGALDFRLGALILGSHAHCSGCATSVPVRSYDLLVHLQNGRARNALLSRQHKVTCQVTKYVRGWCEISSATRSGAGYRGICIHYTDKHQEGPLQSGRTPPKQSAAP